MHPDMSFSAAQAFDHSDLAYCIIRGILDDDGKPYDWSFEYVNDALARLANMPKDQLLHHRFSKSFRRQIQSGSIITIPQPMRARALLCARCRRRSV